jgi:hypothetical protein
VRGQRLTCAHPRSHKVSRNTQRQEDNSGNSQTPVINGCSDVTRHDQTGKRCDGRAVLLSWICHSGQITGYRAVSPALAAGVGADTQHGPAAVVSAAPWPSPSVQPWCLARPRGAAFELFWRSYSFERLPGCAVPGPIRWRGRDRPGCPGRSVLLVAHITGTCATNDRRTKPILTTD